MDQKSKTQIKKELLQLQGLGKKLVDLSPEKIARIDMPEKLKEAVLSAKSMRKHGALSRQLHYIGALIREVDPEPIRQALECDEASRVSNARLFKRAELWRDALVEGDESVLEEIFESFPHADRQHLWQLVRNAQKEKLTEKPPRSSRALFRALRDLLDTASDDDGPITPLSSD